MEQNGSKTNNALIKMDELKAEKYRMGGIIYTLVKRSESISMTNENFIFPEPLKKPFTVT